MTSTEYRLPAPPFGAAEMTIARWLKQPGELVAAGEPLLVALNDRVELLLPSAAAGVLERVVAEPGARVQAGALLAMLAPGAEIPAGPSDQSADVRLSPRVSPTARRIARVYQIDINNIQGSGVAGRIVKRDILGLIEKRDFSSEPALPLTDITIDQNGERLAARASSVFGLPSDQPCALTAMDVDLSRVAAAGARAWPVRGGAVAVGELAFIARAVAAALLRHPLLNGSWGGDRLLVRRRVHLALADPAGKWTLVRDAQDLNARGLARALRGARAAEAPDDATFSIVDLGLRQWFATPAPARAQLATLGVGAVRARPVVVTDGGIDRVLARPTALLTLAYDARAIDQSHADAFLAEVKRWLENTATA